MLKPTVKRGLMLDFLPKKITPENEINQNRVFNINNHQICDGDIIYTPTRELRLEDNWAVVLGLKLAKENNKNFKIIVNLDNINCSVVQKPFLKEGLNFFEKNSALNNTDFEINSKMPQKIGALIVDFNPINLFSTNPDYPVYEVDSHNIIPARHISDKQEFSAATLRRKIYGEIAGFLKEYPIHFYQEKPCIGMQKCADFINNKLDYYTSDKNDALNDVTSGLSPYLHFGFISSQRVTLEILKSSASRENKEAFLEELIVRKELSDNFCLYSKSYSTLDGILDWAKATLNEHRNDIRTYIYSKEEFGQGKTHDQLWNKIQVNLLKNARIHGYLRMYWAKKILEWTNSPEEALEIAIYLNDTYALDGNDPNGYVGILWSIGGLHDRPFTNRPVTGKIRYMGGKNIKF